MAANRSERLAFAKALIIEHPSWGKDTINKAVKKEYGVGLRRIDVAHLKDVTLLGRPKAQTGRKPVERLIREQVLLPDISARVREAKAAVIGFDEAFHTLRAAGFIPDEIRHIFSAANVPALFSTGPFKAMLRDRREWLRQMRKAGKSKEDILKAIKRYYAAKDPVTGQPKNSPFDFLRDAGYRQPRKGRITIKRYRELAQKRAAKKTRKLYRIPA